MAESSASISGDGERRVVIAVPEGGAGPTNVREDADAPSPAPPAQLLRQSTQLDRTESFKAVAIDDVEGAVHSFIASEQTHKLQALFDTFDLDGNGALSNDEVLSMVRTLHINVSEEKVLAMMQAADLDDNGEVDFEEFTRAMHDNDFFELVTIAYFPAEVYKILQEGSERFLSTFKDYVVDIVNRCQAQVLAANVPLASYGRVHSALADVQSALEGTAHEILTDEFTHLRTGAIESLKAQRDAIEANHEAHFQAAIAPFKEEADRRIAGAEAQVAEAAQLREAVEAESARLHALFSEPEAKIIALQAELEAASQRAATLDSQATAYRVEWDAAYAQAIAASTVAPPPLPSDAPYLDGALEERQMTVKGLLSLLSVDAHGMVSKAEVRRTMAKLELIPAKYGEVHKQAKAERVSSSKEAKDHASGGDAATGGSDVEPLIRRLDEAPGGPAIALEELRALWRAWEGPSDPSLREGAKGTPSKGGKASKSGSSSRGRREKPTDPAEIGARTESGLGRALDRSFADEAHGARLLYLIELYEKALERARIELVSAHAKELQRVREEAAAQGSSAAEAEAERLAAWEAEREAVASAHAAQLHDVERRLGAEKAARQEEVSRLRASAEAAQATAVRALVAKGDELRTQLATKSAECEQLREQLSKTTAELQQTRVERENTSFMVKQTKDAQEAEHDAYEKKLQRINAALRKAEAAMPTQGGFYSAAARAPPPRPRPLGIRPVPATSAAVPATPAPTSPDGLFNQTRQAVPGTASSTGSASPETLSTLPLKLPADAGSSGVPRASPSEVSVSQRSERTKSSKGKGKKKGGGAK